MEKPTPKHWWHTDRLDAVGWGVVIIWGALILLFQVAGISDDWSWWDGWGVFLTGAGAITIAITLLRMRLPEYRSRWLGGLIWGGILLAIGLGNWTTADWLWVVALFIVGIVIIREAIVHKR
jgi:hypothetical protein